jgi:CubicO group peptidase (beta-lactamase class C family)
MSPKTISLVTLAAVLALHTLLPGSAAAQADRDQQVRSVFEGSTDPRGPGCAVSVVRAGAVAYQQAWGLADPGRRLANGIDTIFEAGSVSKQFTAAAVAVLVAQGRLNLDDDVRRFLPEMKPYERPITIRMLLTHTSGVRNWDDLLELAGRPREDASGLSQADALAIILRQSELNFPPGAEYLYSNSNYVLAAAIVERVSGETFSSFSRRALFLPAGLSQTQWRDDYRRPVPGRATAYTPDDNGMLKPDMPEESVVGPGGLLTSIVDLQRWNALLDRPGEARGWVNILTQTRGRLADGTPTQYGLGLEFARLQGHDIISHAGATAGYRAYLARIPDQKLSAAVLCNAGAVNSEDAGPVFLSLFMPPATQAAPPRIAGFAARSPTAISAHIFFPLSPI